MLIGRPRPYQSPSRNNLHLIWEWIFSGIQDDRLDGMTNGSRHQPAMGNGP